MTSLLFDEYQPGLHGRLCSLAMPAPGLTAASFLRQGRGQERFFFRDVRTAATFAGVGVAAHLMGYGETRFASIRRQAQALFRHAVNVGEAEPLAGPRLFGGFAFRDDFTPDITWTAFHPAHFILPHYQLLERNGDVWLTINTLLPLEESPQDNRPMLQEALETRYEQLLRASGNPTENRREASQDAPQIDYPLPFSAWAQMIHAAQEAFQRTRLQKVVLSRICQAAFHQPVDVDAALARLTARYPDCFGFLFEPQPGHAFLGASPELLVQLRGASLETMGLAGSIQRGRTQAEDAVLAQELLASPKNRREHAVVVDSIRRRLQPLTSRLDIPQEPQVLTLSNIQHLYTPIRGELARPQGVLPLVEELHPTPALGGTPRALALAFIRDHEPTLRGWYAAPVGWIDGNLDGTFTVAIRSAVVQGKRAWLYAGAGIVAGSVPALEWEETEWKFRPMKEALGIGEEA